jgi:hypothetical protein
MDEIRRGDMEEKRTEAGEVEEEERNGDEGAAL